MGNLVQATTSFAIGLGSGEELVHIGEIFDEDHEIVRRTAGIGYWRPLQARGQVEQATAAPGEERVTKRTRKTSAADK